MVTLQPLHGLLGELMARPKGVRNKSKIVRGRPKGSRNKSKLPITATQITEKALKDKLRPYLALIADKGVTMELLLRQYYRNADKTMAYLEQLVRLEKLKYNAVLRQKEYEEGHKLEYFVPYDYQKRIPEAFREGFNIVVIPVSNKTGKTRIGAALVHSWAIGYEPWKKYTEEFKGAVKVGEYWYMPSSLGKKPPVKILISGEDWEEHAGETLVPELEFFEVDKEWEKRKNNVGVYAHWQHKSTGSEFRVMTYRQDSDLFESFKCDAWWCIDGNQRVLMSDGKWKPISQVLAGSFVWSVDNVGRRSVRQVNRNKLIGDKDCVEVVAKNGFSIVCTKDHKVWTKKGWREVQELQAGDKLYCPLVDYDGVGGDDRLSFVVGSWIGDGWTSGKLTYIAIGKEDFVGYLSSMLPNGYRVVHKHRYDYRISGNGGKNIISETLKSLGLWGKKAHTKFIPSVFFTYSTECRKQLLRGLFTTDGWASGASIGYASTSKQLVMDIHKMLRSVGITSAYYFKKSQRVGLWKDQYHLVIKQSSNVLKFCNEIGIPCKEDAVNKVKMEAQRRYQSMCSKCVFPNQGTNKIETRKKSERQRDQYFSIKSIIPVGKRLVYDIEVDYTHSFICEGIKVSNCDEPPPQKIWAGMARALFMTGGKVFMSMTPLKEPWVFDDIVHAQRADVKTITNVTLWDAPHLYDNDLQVLINAGLTEDRAAKVLAFQKKEAPKPVT